MASGRGTSARPWWRRSLARAGRRTNLALLWMLVGAFLSGWVAFATGRPATAPLATAAHGLFGLGVVALVPWKSVVIKRASAFRVASLALLFLVVSCLVAGFVQLFAGFGYLAGVSPIQVHVGAALVAAPLLAFHILRHRRQRLRPTDFSRRTLLRGAAVAAGASAGYAALAVAAQWTGGAARRPAGTGSRAVDPDAIPATIWLFDRVPEIQPDDYRVDVAGVSLSVADLAATSEARHARLDCTSGWYADATWTGARLSDLIAPDVLAAAVSLTVTSRTGYVRTFPATEAADLWLATSCQGRPLTAVTGAPVRLVAPQHRGFWWVKWVATVEVSPTPAWLQLPFPPQ